jgi:hypothetical protein
MFHRKELVSCEDDHFNSNDGSETDVVVVVVVSGGGNDRDRVETMKGFRVLEKCRLEVIQILYFATHGSR